MKRSLAYITAAWRGDPAVDMEQAAHYCRVVYDAGYSPICPMLYLPLFLNDAVPEEHKNGIDMGRDLLRRSRVLVVCGHSVTEAMKNDMHVTNDFVTSAVNVNFHSGVSTWCYFDEFHILLRDALTASYFVAVWKMLRKKGCVPSALTQNVKDLLASREIEAILNNTDFMILLSQAQSDRAILAKQLGISEHQLSYITHSNSGEGLLFYGDVTIPFVDRFPRGEIYNLLTTRPEDLKNEAKTE